VATCPIAKTEDTASRYKQRIIFNHPTSPQTPDENT
jgi:hypothetical protein